MNPSSKGALSDDRLMPTRPALRQREERLEIMKFIVSRMAHDFNNFLAPVLGYCSLIRDDTPAGTSTRQYAETLEQSVRKTVGLLQSILVATQTRQHFHPEPVDFSEFLETSLRQWEAALPKHARVRVRMNLAPCRLSIDREQWVVLLEQILNNARSALATGGELRVSLESVRLSAKEASELGLREGGAFLLSFRDSGIGMSAETLARAVEPFYSTRPKNRALGLGLTMVHSVVRCHGGQLELESQENHGTKVKVWLLSDAAPGEGDEEEETAGRTGKASSPASGSNPGPKRILVVDDDPLVVEVLKTILERLKYRVDVASDGQQGWRSFQRNAGKIDLVISDVAMPKMNGFEMVAQIRKLSPGVKVIWVSGDLAAVPPEVAREYGANLPPLVHKPFNLRDLAALVQQMAG